MPDYRLRAPDPRVGGLFDRGYVGFAQGPETRQRWLATPVPTVTVILNMGAAFGGYPRAFVAGLTDRCDVIEQDGAIECVDLKLTPLGAYRLLGTPLDELTGRVVDLHELLPELPLDRLAEQTWERRFDLIDTMLCDRAALGPRPAGEVAWAWCRLTETHGGVPIGELAEEVGWSRRHLVAKFRQQVGLPPKTLARIVRFQHLVGRLTVSGPVHWTRIAAECGYYDQAHMNRDFREFAGMTPTRFLARLTPVPEVTSVQYTWVSAA